MSFKLFLLSLISSALCFSDQLALTFDDFPMADGLVYNQSERLGKYMDVLSHHKIQAVFFCIGSLAEKNGTKPLFDRLAKHDQLIASHSYRHKHTSAMSYSSFTNDFELCEKALSSYANFRKWYRFPYLDYGTRSALGGSLKKAKKASHYLKQKGYKDGVVTINTFDWYLNHQLQKALIEKKNVNYATLKTVYLSLLEEWTKFYRTMLQRKHPSSQTIHTLLLHANDLNALYLEDILVMLKNTGWEITSADKAFNQPLLEKNYQDFRDLCSMIPSSLNLDQIQKRLDEASVFTASDIDQDVSSNR